MDTSESKENYCYHWCVLFVILPLNVGVLLLRFLLGSSIKMPTFGKTIENPIHHTSLQLVFFGLYIVIGSLLFVILITKLRDLGIRLLYSLGFSFFIVLFLYECIDVLVNDITTGNKSYLLSTLVISLPLFYLRFVYIYISGKVGLFTRNIGLLWTALVSGRIFYHSFEFVAILSFMVLIAIFDVWSVFFGDLSKTVMVDDPESTCLSRIELFCQKGIPFLYSRDKKTMIGIGDVFLYVILINCALCHWGWHAFFLVNGAIIIGNLLTMQMLKEVRAFPGLPIPIFLSMIMFGLCQQL